MWSLFENGKTIRAKGSENGVIVIDEEHEMGARVTLEENTNIAPFAITVGVYGLFFHTVYLGTIEEARNTVTKMKTEIAEFLTSSEDSDAWVEEFVSLY